MVRLTVGKRFGVSRFAAVGVAVGVVCGFAIGDDEVSELTLIALSNVCRETLLHESEGAKIESIERDDENGVQLIAAKWRDDAAEYEVVIDMDGNLVEIEQAISKSEVPDKVGAVFAQHFPGDADVSFGKKRVVFYEAEAEVNGKTREVVVDTLGETIRVVEEQEDEETEGEDKADGDDASQLRLDQCPAAVIKTIRRELAGGKITDIEMEYGIYEAEIELDGREYDLEVRSDGVLIHKRLEEE